MGTLWSMSSVLTESAGEVLVSERDLHSDLDFDRDREELASLLSLSSQSSSSSSCLRVREPVLSDRSDSGDKELVESAVSGVGDTVVLRLTNVGSCLRYTHRYSVGRCPITTLSTQYM